MKMLACGADGGGHRIAIAAATTETATIAANSSGGNPATKLIKLLQLKGLGLGCEKGSRAGLLPLLGKLFHEETRAMEGTRVWFDTGGK